MKTKQFLLPYLYSLATIALTFLVGQCMKASKGKANPGMMKEIISKKLNNI